MQLPNSEFFIFSIGDDETDAETGDAFCNTNNFRINENMIGSHLPSCYAYLLATNNEIK